MKIKVDKDQLQKAIQTVQNVVSPKVTLPILSNMLMEVNNETANIYTTDLDIGISCDMPITTLEQGSITIPAKRFSEIVRELPSADVTINVKKNNQIDIEGEQCRFKLIGLPKEEFPQFPQFDPNEASSIDQHQFKEMIRLTNFAVSHEESRYVLNGVLLEIEKDVIRMVSTDGRRLAKVEKPLESKVNKPIRVIIPIKAIQEINRNLKEEGSFLFIPGQNQVFFNIDGVLIATRIIEGDFPNYNQVIPKENPQKIMVNTQDFFAAIKRANLLATPDFQAIKFEIFKDKLVISKTTPDVGESREELAINYGGSEMVVGFNPQYMLDVLKNLSDEEIPLEILGPDKPCVIRLEDYLYLALPMRI